MKHAILITAYKNLSSIQNIIDFFDADKFNFYIHIDKKSKLDGEILMKSYKNVFVSSKYVVNWGGTNHLKAILELCIEALKDSQNQIFHLITAEDYPIKPEKCFMKLETDKIYLEYMEIPSILWSGNGGMDRIDYFNFFDTFNAKKKLGLLIIKGILKIQKFLKLKRPKNILKNQKLYGGSTYWTISREGIEYVLNFTQNNPSFFNRFLYTFCAEEFYFQTLLLNSPLSEKIVNDNLRYIIWDYSQVVNPQFIKVENVEKIVKSDKFFTRKINSSEVISLINSKVEENENMYNHN